MKYLPQWTRRVAMDGSGRDPLGRVVAEERDQQGLNLLPVLAHHAGVLELPGDRQEPHPVVAHGQREPVVLLPGLGVEPVDFQQGGVVADQHADLGLVLGAVPCVDRGRLG